MEIKTIYSQLDKIGHCTKNETADLVTFTEEILNGKLYFLHGVKLQLHQKLIKS